MVYFYLISVGYGKDDSIEYRICFYFIKVLALQITKLKRLFESVMGLPKFRLSE